MQEAQRLKRCKQCGERFVPTGNNQRFCRPCSRERRNAKQHQYNQRHKIRYQGGEGYD